MSNRSVFSTAQRITRPRLTSLIPGYQSTLQYSPGEREEQNYPHYPSRAISKPICLVRKLTAFLVRSQQIYRSAFCRVERGPLEMGDRVMSLLLY